MPALPVRLAAGLATFTAATMLAFAQTALAASVALPTPDHVLIVVMENKDTGEILGSSAAPWMNGLARAGANFTNAHAETHPSQPNYLALFSGSTQGVTGDGCANSFGGPNLGSELIAAGKTFVGYAEELPHAGSTTCSAGRYARKHSPWVNFTDLPGATTNLPASELGTDWDRLPTVAFLTPDLCHDMHDCPVSAGDAWAANTLGSYLEWAQTHNSLLVLTFDESETSTSGNPIPTIFAGPMVRPGEVTTRVDHYTMLRTIEDMYGLKALGASADAAPITGIWRTPTSAPQAPANPVRPATPAVVAPGPTAGASAPSVSTTALAVPAPHAALATPTAAATADAQAPPVTTAPAGQPTTYLGAVLIHSGAATRAQSGVPG